jgi:Putative peptidoglycan binding domain
MLTINSITLLAGLVLIVVGLLGGGIEAKEIKIPQLPAVPRTACFFVGCILVGLVLFDPALFVQAQPPEQKPPTANSISPPDTRPRELGAAIKTHLTTVTQVKSALKNLGMYGGNTNDANPDDDYFKAVANFQRSRNIVQDGLVGGETYGKLREAAPELFGEKPSK